ncbi:MAG: trigger factor, partial [Gammaproteobacteria bacterium]|nr:trigger factor [Gammaproteobacteria bacterium]
MTITVGSDSFETQITDRLKQTAGQVKLRGFRPGKVPLKEVRRRYGPSVRQEVASELMQSSFVEAVQTEDLKPAGSPNLEVTNLEAGADLEFIATFEVFPDVQLGDLTTVAVKKPEAEITGQDVDTMIDTLRDQRKHFDDV